MKTSSFNILKPLSFTALIIVFASSLNIAEAFDGCGGNPGCQSCNQVCYSDGDCPQDATCAVTQNIFKTCNCVQ